MTDNNTCDNTAGGNPRGTAGGCSSAGAVAGLAREIEALRERVADLVELPGVVSELGGMVAELAEELTAHSARPARDRVPSWLDLPATLPAPENDPTTADPTADDVNVDVDVDGDGGDPVGGATPPGRVDPDAVRVLVGELSGWVGRVYLRYTDAAREFPECWLWHPDVVEELLWLSRAWHQAYLGDGGSVLAVGDWHDRYRPGVVRRITREAGSCSLERHTTTSPGADGVQPPLTGAVNRIASWWANPAGEGGVCPAPSPEDLDDAARYWRTTTGGGH